MENSKTPKIIGPPLSIEETMKLRVGEGISITIIFVLSKITEEGIRDVLTLERFGDEKLQFPKGKMRPGEDPLQAGKRILIQKMGYFFKPEQKNIFFSVPFSSTIASESHYKIFMSVEEFIPGWSTPKKQRRKVWNSLNNIKEKIITTHQFCLESYKDRIKLIDSQNPPPTPDD